LGEQIAMELERAGDICAVGRPDAERGSGVVETVVDATDLVIAVMVGQMTASATTAAAPRASTTRSSGT
jgi:hypothetical protein